VRTHKSLLRRFTLMQFIGRCLWYKTKCVFFSAVFALTIVSVSVLTHELRKASFDVSKH
jgi:hypothetical protein